LVKIGFSFVEEEHWIGLAIEAGEVELLESWGRSNSRGGSSHPPPPSSDGDDDLSFMVAISAFTEDNSVWNDFISSMRSLMVGSAMVVDVEGNGGGLERVGEDLPDTRLSSASTLNVVEPWLRNL
jgi:hypothetical protein